MNYTDFVKEVSTKSKETSRPLAQDDVKMCIDLAREVIIDLLKKEDKLVIRNFLKFETKHQKGRVINVVNSNKKIDVPDSVVAKVSLGKNFKDAVKKVY